MTTQGSTGRFVAKLGKDGDLVWAKVADGAIGHEKPWMRPLGDDSPTTDLG